jgi:hypothetical protein
MKTVLGKENDNELKKIQKILLNQMGRLDNNEIMKEQGKREIMRSGALSQSASSYIKSVATQIKVLELTSTYNVEPNDMNKYLGIESENK